MPQHYTFEEEFHDGPQPTSSYEEGYIGPQPERYTAYVPGQKLQTSDLQRGNKSGTGARLALALISLGMIFTVFLVVISITSSFRAIGFALVFTGAAIIINIVFNRKR